MNFNDRRPPMNQPGHPDAVKARLTGSPRTKVEDGSRYGGHHGVYHNGQRVGVLTDFGDGDADTGRYEAHAMNPHTQVLGSSGLTFQSRARAARWVVAAHDVSAHKLSGMTEAHWSYVDGKHK